MRFVIRDDDTSYFTQPEELEGVYADIVDVAPVSLAVVPYDVPSFHRGEPDRFYQQGEPVSIEENGALLAYVGAGVAQRRYDVMLHGYNHRYKVTKDVPYDPAYWIPEFVYLADPAEKMMAGKTLLERLFSMKVSCFVPPSNAISPAGLEALGKAGLNLCCVAGRRTLLKANRLNLVAVAVNQLKPSFPYGVRRYVGHRELLCHALTPMCDWEALCRHLEASHAKKSVFAVATHYWELKRNHVTQGVALREMLIELIDRAKRLDAHFCRASEIFAA